MKDLYKECFDRMNEGGFLLRSWNSNCSKLREMFVEDECFVSHSNNYEKVLGYKYLIESDEFCLTESSIDSCANTKRSILSQISKIFDPIGYFNPITTRGKLIMQEIWGLKLGWDDLVNSEILDKWVKLSGELNKLYSFKFDRNCINEGQDNKLVIFADASKLAYGFNVYNVANQNSRLMFSKSKVAPLKDKRTLPTLELMSIYLSLKLLPTILESYNNIKFEEIFICSDSQISLQWVLSSQLKMKSIFTLNRVKDVKLFKENISLNMSINADLII